MDYSESIKLNPKYGRGYYNRAVAYKQQGDQAKAEADFAKVKELDYELE